MQNAKSLPRKDDDAICTQHKVSLCKTTRHMVHELALFTSDNQNQRHNHFLILIYALNKLKLRIFLADNLCFNLKENECVRAQWWWFGDDDDDGDEGKVVRCILYSLLLVNTQQSLQSQHTQTHWIWRILEDNKQHIICSAQTLSSVARGMSIEHTATRRHMTYSSRHNILTNKQWVDFNAS